MKKLCFAIIAISIIVILGCKRSSTDLTMESENMENFKVVVKRDINQTNGNIVSSERRICINRNNENSTDMRHKNSDIPTIDENTSQQISHLAGYESYNLEKVSVSVGGVTDSKIILNVKNLSEEVLEIREIYFLEYQNEQWVRIKTHEGKQVKLPAYGLASNDNMCIEFDFALIYGIIDKGEYICVINISGSLVEIKIEIK